MYVIRPLHNWWNLENWDTGSSLPENFNYTSDNNKDVLSIKQLKELVNQL